MEKRAIDTNQLTFTRFLASLTIVIYHFGDNVYPFSVTYLNSVVHSAYLGVSYFFMLSGLVMILAYGKKRNKVDFNSYIKNRIARILPLYYFGLILMLCYLFVRIVIFKQSSTYRPNFEDFFLNLLLVQSWFPDKALTINTAAWSLSVEMFFYLLFPLILNKVYVKLNSRLLLVGIGVAFLISQICFHTLVTLYPDYRFYFQDFPLLRLSEFLMGNALGLIVNESKHKEGRNLLLPILLFFSITIAAIFFPMKNINYAAGLYTIYFFPLVYCIAMDNGPVALLFRKRIFVYLGEISYGIYILQFPVYFFFTASLTVFHYKINQPLFYVYIMTLIMVAAFSYRYVELPLRERIKAALSPKLF